MAAVYGKVSGNLGYSHLCRSHYIAVTQHFIKVTWCRGSHLSVSSFLNNHSVFLTISPIKKTHTHWQILCLMTRKQRRRNWKASNLPHNIKCPFISSWGEQFVQCYCISSSNLPVQLLSVTFKFSVALQRLQKRLFFCVELQMGLYVLQNSV